jgi:hypothetical protein
MSKKEYTLEEQHEILRRIMSGDVGKRKEYEWNVYNSVSLRTGYLRHNPDLVYELAKPFTQAKQMKEYKGENEKQIRTAGRYFTRFPDEFPRPEWFDKPKRRKNKDIEPIEQVIERTKQYSSLKEWKQKDLRGYHRISEKYSPEEKREMFPNLNLREGYLS